MKGRIVDRIRGTLQWVSGEIESDALIGLKANIIKGAVICNEYAVAIRSIVVCAIPSGVVAGYNPARVLRMIEG